MTEWLRQYWWAIFGAVATVLYIAWRMRVEKSEGSFLRRLLHALAPTTNLKGPAHTPLTPRMAWFIGAALVLIMLANLWFNS
ncbi:MAG: hypothetical protein LKCHEGNO_01712 [Burkholderiaceae bacterium]|nr:hypothetical protein [Burkholderiaceae bacterium]